MAKNEKVDIIQVWSERADRLSVVYANGTFWKTVKLACDALKEDSVTTEVTEVVDKERKTWGKVTSNRKMLDRLYAKLQGEDE